MATPACPQDESPAPAHARFSRRDQDIGLNQITPAALDVYRVKPGNSLAAMRHQHNSSTQHHEFRTAGRSRGIDTEAARLRKAFRAPQMRQPPLVEERDGTPGPGPAPPARRRLRQRRRPRAGRRRVF